MKSTGAEVQRLAMLTGKHQVAMGLRNHSGNYICEAVWDTWAMIHDLDPRSTGFYYDPGHAAIEGGLGGHDVSSSLSMPRLTMTAVKDFFWRKDASGLKSTGRPVGEGAVDWKSVMAALPAADNARPIFLRQQYTAPDMLRAPRKNIAFLPSMVESA